MRRNVDRFCAQLTALNPDEGIAANRQSALLAPIRARRPQILSRILCHGDPPCWKGADQSDEVHDGGDVIAGSRELIRKACHSFRLILAACLKSTTAKTPNEPHKRNLSYHAPDLRRYAMTEPAVHLVTVPRWARLLHTWPSFGGPRPSRRDVLLVEAFVVTLAIVLFVASFLVTSEGVAKILRVGAAFELVCGYLVSWFVRVADTYQMWPGSPGAPPPPPARTWHNRLAEYAFAFGLGLLAIVLACWAAF